MFGLYRYGYIISTEIILRAITGMERLGVGFPYYIDRFPLPGAEIRKAPH